VNRACLAFPVLPGRGDLARSFLREIAEGRQSDFARAGERLALTRAHWFLVDTAGGELVVVYLEGRDVTVALDGLVRSRDPFDLWFKACLAEATGLDLNDLPEGMRPPELLASFAADPGQTVC
jgi:hypothetical protein